MSKQTYPCKGDAGLFRTLLSLYTFNPVLSRTFCMASVMMNGITTEAKSLPLISSTKVSVCGTVVAAVPSVAPPVLLIAPVPVWVGVTPVDVLLVVVVPVELPRVLVFGVLAVAVFFLAAALAATALAVVAFFAAAAFVRAAFLAAAVF